MKRFNAITTVILLLAMGCAGALPTDQTPMPTYTPYPTYTPWPTHTPLPALPTATPQPTHTATPSATATSGALEMETGDASAESPWQVDVKGVQVADEFGEYSVTEGSKNHMVIVDLDYTYNGTESAQIYPESVVLVYTGEPGLTGWAQTPTLYQGGPEARVRDLTIGSVWLDLDPPATRSAILVYEFPREYTDFRLYFPGVKAVPITLSASGTGEASTTSTDEADDIALWKVEVTNIRTAEEFDTFYMKEGSKNHMVIVDLDYTHDGSESAEFYPESVVLVYTGETGGTGWAQTPTLFQDGPEAEVVDFTKAATVIHLDSPTTRSVTLVYEFPKAYSDFRLYFPGAMAVSVTLPAPDADSATTVQSTATPAPSTPTAGTGQATGRFSCDGEPVEGVKAYIITIDDGSGTVHGMAVSDEEGRWLVTGLRPGSYYLWPGRRPEARITTSDEATEVAEGEVADFGDYDVGKLVENEVLPPEVCERSRATSDSRGEAQEPSPDAVVIASGLNMREGPGTEHPILRQLKQADELYVIGQFGNCAWLKVTASGPITGWVSGGSAYVELRRSCDSIPRGTFRPLTSLVRRYTEAEGHGELTVENGTEADGVAILTTLDEQPVVAAYIRNHESFTIEDIPQGTYRLYFSTGSEWDGEQREFTDKVRRQRFEDIFPFSETATTYSIWKVTLHGVVGGTAAAEEVDRDRFPDISD